jgi:hypothetical protein
LQQFTSLLSVAAHSKYLLQQGLLFIVCMRKFTLVVSFPFKSLLQHTVRVATCY